MLPVRISGLHVYPIKGCGGTRVSAARVTPTGLQPDRQLIVAVPSSRAAADRPMVTLHDCAPVADAGCTQVMVTQRTHPQMARVRPSLSADGLLLDLAPVDGGLSYDNSSCSVQLRQSTDESDAATVKVWGTHVQVCLSVS